MKTMTRFPLEELVKLPSFYFPVPSWDGTRVAYFSDQSGRMELWVMDLESGSSRQVSKGQVPRAIHGNFIWDRAGRSLVFCRDEGGDEQNDALTRNSHLYPTTYPDARREHGSLACRCPAAD